MKAIGYIRVSTEEQVKDGVSLDNQRVKLSAYAICKDLELIEIVDDSGFSAKDLKRPGIQRVIELVQSKAVDAVVIYKLDRLTRSVKDLGYLIELFQKTGVELMSVQDSIDTSTAAGRLVLNVMASVSQWEREVIAERTVEALAHKKANNKAYGPTPYGFKRVGDDLIPDEIEQEILKTINRLRSRGESFRSIAKELERRGCLTKKGNTKWHPDTIKGILAA